jgi:hypothetical protein
MCRFLQQTYGEVVLRAKKGCLRALRAIKGDEDAVGAGWRFRRFFAASSTERIPLPDGQ